jgi:hypothetical protein
VLHPFQDLKSPFQNIMGRAALNIRGKPYTAGIMLIFPSVQPLLKTLAGPLLTIAHTDPFLFRDEDIIEKNSRLYKRR